MGGIYAKMTKKAIDLTSVETKDSLQYTAV